MHLLFGNSSQVANRCDLRSKKMLLRKRAIPPYLTTWGWSSSLKSAISRMQVLGTPSGSLQASFHYGAGRVKREGDEDERVEADLLQSDQLAGAALLSLVDDSVGALADLRQVLIVVHAARPAPTRASGFLSKCSASHQVAHRTALGAENDANARRFVRCSSERFPASRAPKGRSASASGGAQPATSSAAPHLERSERTFPHRSALIPRIVRRGDRATNLLRRRIYEEPGESDRPPQGDGAIEPFKFGAYSSLIDGGKVARKSVRDVAFRLATTCAFEAAPLQLLLSASLPASSIGCRLIVDKVR